MESSTMKKKIFLILEGREEAGVSGWIFNTFLLVLICANSLSVFVETFDLSKHFEFFLSKLELFSIIFFSIEYVLRIWTSDMRYRKCSGVKARLKYVFSFMALVDFFCNPSFFCGCNCKD